MKAKEFNKLLEQHKANPQQLIRMHCNRDIYLASYQFDKVVRLRDGKKLKYENDNKGVDNSYYNNVLCRIQNYIKRTVRIEALQERIRLYLTKWR